MTEEESFLKDLKKKKIKKFIEVMHEAKIETERKMRYELDYKILRMRTERLNQALGSDFIKRIRYFIKKYYGVEDHDFFSGEDGDISPRSPAKLFRAASVQVPLNRKSNVLNIPAVP